MVTWHAEISKFKQDFVIPLILLYTSTDFTQRIKVLQYQWMCICKCLLLHVTVLVIENKEHGQCVEYWPLGAAARLVTGILIPVQQLSHTAPVPYCTCIRGSLNPPNRWWPSEQAEIEIPSLSKTCFLTFYCPWYIPQCLISIELWRRYCNACSVREVGNTLSQFSCAVLYRSLSRKSFAAGSMVHCCSKLKWFEKQIYWFIPSKIFP